MTVAFKIYGDQFEKDSLIRIATEIYGFMVAEDFAKNDSAKNKLKELLEEKIICGLAAKAFLELNNKS